LKHIEQEIRAALDTELTLDVDSRQLIYQAANAALKQILSVQTDLSDSIRQVKIGQLAQIIATIEKDFDPTFDDNSDVQHIDDDFNQKYNRGFKKIFVLFAVITFLALLLMFGWSFIGGDNDRLRSNLQSIGTPNDGNDAWITLFEPTEASNVQVSNGLIAEYHNNQGDAYLSLLNSGTQKGVATFDVGKGILETLRGKKVIFDIQAKTIDGVASQMSVSCILANVGNCKRTQFKFEGQTIDNLLSVQLNDQMPSTAGQLNIMPDVGNAKNPIKIFSVRVRQDGE
jgi:hypothetical protein